MAKSPAPQPFARPCTPFSPARVDNSLVRALVPARDSRRGVPSRRPWLAHALFPRDTRPRRSQQTSRHGAEAAGSFGGAGRGPMPPSSTAAPSCAPPRRFLHGVQATQSLRTSGRKGLPVCAAVGGPVSAASLKSTLRGWTAPALRWAARRCSGPPSARQRARTAAAPCLTSSPPTPPPGASRIVYHSWR